MPVPGGCGSTPIHLLVTQDVQVKHRGLHAPPNGRGRSEVAIFARLSKADDSSRFSWGSNGGIEMTLQESSG